MNRKVLLGQGLCYVATGLWPLIHMKTFEALTVQRPTGGW